MQSLIKKELLAVAADYGDDRRTPLMEAEESQAFSEEDLMTNDPITVVLSTKGWVRAAKGHDVKPHELNYRTGDEFSQAAKGRSNDVLVFLDSDGRSYNAAAHTLPSARGQGEPLSGRFKAKNDARFVGVLMGNADAKVLLVSNAGFGFVGTLSEMVTKNKAGKACLSVPSGGYALPPLLIDPALHASDDAQVAAVTNQGRLLVFALKDLPELARGKGNKLLNVPSADFKSGEEELVGAVALGEKDELLVHAGQRHLRLKSKDLENYIGERARRGRKLPRGFQKVERLSVE
jgi:topoisomerase-4 subunit A